MMSSAFHMKISRLSAVGCFLGALCLGLFSYCSFVYSQQYPSGAWHYKMTVEVETPEGIKSGSAVRDVDVDTSTRATSLSGLSSVKAKGEAVVIDLGQRGVLFAILRSSKTVDYSYSVFFDVFPIPGHVGGGATPDGVRYYNQLKHGEVDLPPDEYPEFVRFHDIKDPKTVELVDPANMAASLGEGVKLKAVRIEITDSPLTTGVEKWLVWLPHYYGKMFDGHRYETIKAENRFVNSLNSGAFSTGGFQ